jgi:hypothetical protein
VKGSSEDINAYLADSLLHLLYLGLIQDILITRSKGFSGIDEMGRWQLIVDFGDQLKLLLRFGQGELLRDGRSPLWDYGDRCFELPTISERTRKSGGPCKLTT